MRKATDEAEGSAESLMNAGEKGKAKEKRRKGLKEEKRIGGGNL